MMVENPYVFDVDRLNAQLDAEQDDTQLMCDGCEQVCDDVVSQNTERDGRQSLCLACESAREMNFTDEQGPEMVWLGPIKGREGIKP